jgi:glycerophosphoryl diester phosphodiesterase
MTAPRIAIPEIIAHRGASREWVENTLQAFSGALAQGAEGIELDVHVSADGVVVVHHDPDVAMEPGGPRVPIMQLTTRELSAVRLRGDNRVPTLVEVCELVGRAATLYVEVKEPMGGPGTGSAALVEETLARFPALRAAVHAFDHRLPLAVRSLAPSRAIGFLSASYPVDLASWVTPARPDDWWQAGSLIDQPLVETAHTLGMRVIAWTVNDPEQARQLMTWGVDALCTDTPEALRWALQGG